MGDKTKWELRIWTREQAYVEEGLASRAACIVFANAIRKSGVYEKLDLDSWVMIPYHSVLYFEAHEVPA